MDQDSNRQPEPPDKGKDEIDHPLPTTYDDIDGDDVFRGFPDDDMLDQTQQNRKRRDEKDTKENEKKRTRPTLGKHTLTQTTPKRPNTQTQPSSSSQTPTPIINTSAVTKSGTSNTYNNTIYIKNNAYDVIFIEPISIKEGQKVLEPMEVGKFLHDAHLDQFTELKRAGQYRYKMTYKKPKDTEKILNSTSLLNNNNYRAYIPKMLTETTGVIKDIPTSFTEQEIRLNAICDKKITSVERIKRKRENELINTRTVKITVDGPVLPRVVQIYGVHCKPEIYIFPVRICHKCWRLGHKATACKSKETCQRCGKYISDEHKGCDDRAPPKCKNCGSKHLPTDANCPERKRREHINAAMMLNKMTFTEAAELYPKTQNRYAILESIDEFPRLERQNRPNPGFRQTVETTEKIDYSKIIEKLLKPKQKPTIVKNKFPQEERIPEQVKAITNNPHAVSEAERLKSMSKHLHSFFSTLLNHRTEDQVDSDPSKDLLLIEIGTMIKKIIETIEENIAI